MKKTLLIQLFILILLKVYSQTGWPPIGAKWHYSYVPCDGVGYGCSFNIKEYIYFEAVKDTMVNDTVCTKIVVEYNNDKKEVKYLGDEFIFSTENQVYNYHHGYFHLLYDFSLQVGDTVVLSLGSNCDLYNKLETLDMKQLYTIPIKHFVVAKDSIEINNKKHLYINMDYSFYNEEMRYYPFLNYRMIIKGVGSLAFLTGDFFSPIESGYYGPLRCYSDSSVNYTTDIPCELLTSVEELNQNTKVWVYPNPVTDRSIIYFPNPDQNEVTIEIFDPAGKILSRTETCENYSTIDPLNLPGSIYIYRVYSTTEFIGSGRIVKE